MITLELIKKYYKWVLIVFLTLLLILSVKTCNSNVNKNKISDTNINALADSLRLTKNKLGETQNRKLELVVDLDKLSKINSDLTNEVNKLSKKDKKNLIEITKLSLMVDNLNGEIDSLKSSVIKVNDSVYQIPFEKINKYRELSGYTEFNIQNKQGSTCLTTDKMYLDLTINKIKTKDGIEIVVSSTNPYVSIDKIDGALINPSVYSELVKPDKKWDVSASVGYGLTINGLQPFIGITIGRTIFKF